MGGEIRCQYLGVLTAQTSLASPSSCARTSQRAIISHGTSAAPTLFPSITLNTGGDVVGTGLGHQNPTILMIEEARKKHGEEARPNLFDEPIDPEHFGEPHHVLEILGHG